MISRLSALKAATDFAGLTVSRAFDGAEKYFMDVSAELPIVDSAIIDIDIDNKGQ